MSGQSHGQSTQLAQTHFTETDSYPRGESDNAQDEEDFGLYTVRVHNNCEGMTELQKLISTDPQLRGWTKLIHTIGAERHELKA